MNKTTITGHLGRDPEMRYTPDGKAITSFSVAVNVGAGDNKHTLWFRCSAWEKRAEVCNQYLKKGSHVLVEGSLSGDKSTGGPKIWKKQDGSSGASFELTVINIEFLSPRDTATVSETPDVAGPVDDNIPF